MAKPAIGALRLVTRGHRQLDTFFWPYATRAWRAPTVEARPANPIACAMCGELVLKRRRRHCEACMPKARREHGHRAIKAARKVLAAKRPRATIHGAAPT